MITRFANNFKNFLLDTLFPVFCLSCRKPNEWICETCFEKIKLLPRQVCPYCEKVFSLVGRVCFKCKAGFLNKNKAVPLDNLIVAVPYDKFIVSRLVHLYKYNFIEDLSLTLGKLMVKSLVENNIPLPELIIPVPLHKRRLRWRGFNQAEKLAGFISENLSSGFPIPVSTDILGRKRYTLAQMKIKNYSERKKNIQNTFEINVAPVIKKPCKASNIQSDSKILKNKKILLIDDVCTTGSTIFECAKVLKLAGARQVTGAVIARQEITSKR